MGKYDPVTHQGKRFDRMTKEYLVALERYLGYRKGSLDIVQGSYNAGGVAQSAGTHDGGGAFDLTASSADKKVLAGRRLGAAIWDRKAIPGHWNRHVHGIVRGNSKASRGALNQIADMDRNDNGLAGSARDDGPRMKARYMFQYGVPRGKWKLRRAYVGRLEASKKSSARHKFGQGDTVTVFAAVKNVDEKTRYLLAETPHGKLFFPASALRPAYSVRNEKWVADTSCTRGAYPTTSSDFGKRTVLKKGKKVNTNRSWTDEDGKRWVRTRFGNWYPVSRLNRA